MISLWYYFLASTICLFSATQTYAAVQNMTAEDPVVGWDAGPNRRGTLRLIWSCVATIFTCTWTVLHLNVPGHKDSPARRLSRKIKWLAINVLFPEFIFSKAICDLRLALDELRRFDEGCRVNGPMEWKRGHCRGYWEIKYPPGSNILYRMLGLQWPPRDLKIADTETPTRPAFWRQHSTVQATTNPAPQHQNSDDTLIQKKFQQDTGVPLPYDEKLKQAMDCTECAELANPSWTIVHSYYAQMGGILCLHKYAGHEGLAGCFPFATPTMIWAFDWVNNQHPLKDFTLREEDIQDRSKADWLAKGISIIQITWLIFNVTVRGMTGLPVTQLEIAAFAFAVMAIGIYVANWWKPKDVSRPTVQSATFKSHIITDTEKHPLVRSFTDGMHWPRSIRRVNPSPKSFWEWNFATVTRVENDLVWLEGEPSYFFVVTGLSSLVFGGMHCIAWNFDFPSRAEHVGWRVASVVTAVLPVVVLGLNFVLDYISNNYGRSRRNKTLIAELEPLKCLSSSWWHAAMGASFMSWNANERTTFWFLQEGDLDWEERPSEEAIRNTRLVNEYRKEWWTHKAELTAEFFSAFTQFGRHWDGLRAMGEKGFRSKQQLNEFYHEVEAINSSFLLMQPFNEVFWASYEDRLKHTVPDSGAEYLEATVVEHIVKAFQHAEGEFGQLQERCEHAAKIVANLSSIIYVIARLMVIVLMFTCLRAVPVGVYQVTPWTRYFPKIS